MRTVEEVQALIRQHQDVLQARYGVVVTGIFGSYVRGDQQLNSDIDLLVEITRPISLLELVGADLYLSEVLDTKVDLVSKRSLREELRGIILEELVSI